jgi:isoleucyl-tRNA synthetase
MIAPYVPFISEEIYRNLTTDPPSGEESVHLDTYPETGIYPCTYSDELLEVRMDLIRRIVLLGRSLRNEAGIKVRQPLRAIIVVSASEKRKTLIAGMERLVQEEINVKEIEFMEGVKSLQIKKADPNYKSLGPKFGKNIHTAVEIIKSFSEDQISRIENNGEDLFAIDGHKVSITKDDISIRNENIAGILVASDGDLSVALDTNLTAELVLEGLAREFVNRVQNTRKEAGFDVVDRIKIYCNASGQLADAIAKQNEYIRNETLAIEINCANANGDFKKEWQLDDHKVTIGISKVLT